MAAVRRLPDGNDSPTIRGDKHSCDNARGIHGRDRVPVVAPRCAESAQGPQTQTRRVRCVVRVEQVRCALLPGTDVRPPSFLANIRRIAQPDYLPSNGTSFLRFGWQARSLTARSAHRGHPPRPPADHRRDRAPVRHQPRRQQLQLASLRRWRRSTLPSHFAVHAFLISAPHSAARQVPCLLSSPCGLPHDFSGPTLSFCEDAGRSPAIANPPLTFSDTHGCLTLTTVRPRSLPCMLFHPHSFPGHTPSGLWRASFFHPYTRPVCA